MADEIEPTEEPLENAENEEPEVEAHAAEGEETAQDEESPEVEAHSAEEVLGLQGIDEASQTGVSDPSAGSCSSCIGSTCF